MKQIEVVAAIIHRDGAILATQRGYGEFKGFWEFPGGKIEVGENREQALMREIEEELSARIQVEEWVDTIEYDYPNFHLRLYCGICHLLSDEFQLNEHLCARWLKKEELMQVEWLPADVELVKTLQQRTFQ